MKWNSVRLLKLSFIGIGFALTLSCSHYSTRNHRDIGSMAGYGDTAEDISDFGTMPAPGELNTEAYKNEYAFDWPIDRARLTRGFRTEGGRRRPHLGIDLAAPRKTPIYAAHQGMVIYAGRDFRGFGKMVLIESGHGWATLYAHLDKILVTEGQKVKLGETVALVGSTGRSTGPHLHFEIRRNKGPVDPLQYLPGGAEASRKLAGK